MSASRRRARWALVTVLFSAVVAWCLYVAGAYSDVLVESGRSADELYGPTAAEVFYPSRYLIFAAIAVFGCGALIGKRRMQRERADSEEAPSALVNAVHDFSGTAVIITLILATLAAVSVFLDGFFSAPGDINPVLRVFNLYLPIVLYTALAVTAILAGFVLGRYQRPAEAPQPTPPAPAPAGDPLRAHADAQRSLALAYATPIVSVAVALIFGLIVYDVNQTALEVWIWVIVQAFIAAGVIGGTYFARKGIDAQSGPGGRPGGASVAAKNLNLVLSIIFAGAVTLMSLGFGSTAVEQLRVQPFLSLNAYTDTSKEFPDPSQPTTIDSVTLQLNGSDLQRASAATVSLRPGDATVVEATADRDGYLFAEGTLPDGVAAGAYTLSAEAMSSDGSTLRLALEVTVTEQGEVAFPRGTDAYSSQEAAHVIAVSASWFIGDLIPALVLLLLAAAAIYATLILRNRDPLSA